MDFGDLLFMLLIGSGIVSSLLGKKKKTLPQTRRPRPQPARQRTLPERSRAEPSLDPSHSGPVPTRMEEILRQLGLEVEQHGEELEAPEQAPEIATVGERDAFGREMPRVVSLEQPYVDEAIAPDTEKRHDEFHEQYVRAFSQTRIRRAVSQGHEILNPKSLRQAILMHEILGPPKGLR